MEPPRHGKSELCSHYFPTWYLGARPENKVLFSSYEADFAASWGGKVRDTLNEWGPKVFGVTLDKRSSARDEWLLSNGKGGMKTAGVGGAITGRGGNLLIVDDPVKNSQDAQSEAVRRKQKEWWRSVFRTRAEPDAICLVIGTRWHEDDLIGYLIQEMREDPDADQFIIVRLPAIAEEPTEEWPEPDALGREPGDVLFPERWPAEKLRPHMANANTWAALYQQRPAPAEGGLFQDEWFQVCPIPREMKFKKTVRYWDLAATDPKEFDNPDWSVGLKMGLAEDGFLYILDVKRFQASPGGVDREIRKTITDDGPRVRQRMEQEPGAAGKTAIWHWSRGAFRGRPFRGHRTTGSKVLRAETVSNAAERGEIRLVRANWNRDFLKELRVFPNGSHDDQVDALSGAYEVLIKSGSKMIAA